jgi:hypothetical protein
MDEGSINIVKQLAAATPNTTKLNNLYKMQSKIAIHVYYALYEITLCFKFDLAVLYKD